MITTIGFDRRPSAIALDFAMFSEIEFRVLMRYSPPSFVFQWKLRVHKCVDVSFKPKVKLCVLLRDLKTKVFHVNLVLFTALLVPCLWLR